MSRQSRPRWFRSHTRRGLRSTGQGRRAIFERLEDRWVLSPTLTPIPDISVPANTGSPSYTGYTFDASATAPPGDSLTYSAVVDPASAISQQNLTVSATADGAVTITPAAGIVGVGVIDVTVTDNTDNTSNTQQVAVLVHIHIHGTVHQCRILQQLQI